MKNIKVMVFSALVLTQITSIYTVEEMPMASESRDMQSKIKQSHHEEHHMSGKRENNHSVKNKKPKRSKSTHKSKSTSPHNNKRHKKEETR